MRDINTKTDNTGDTLSAGEFNSIQNELENVVGSADITLDPAAGPDADLNMLGKTIATYAVAGNWYGDGGSANTYVLTRSTNLKSPEAYKDGMKVAFYPANANTGASTVNVASLGVKNIVKTDGSALVANDLKTTEIATMVYNSGSGNFRLLSSQFVRNSGDTIAGDLTISGTLTVSTDLNVTNDVDIDGNVDIDGYLETDSLRINGSVLTATPAEINSVCDGNTATADEITKAADGIGVAGGMPRQKIITMGDWDMDADSELYLTHGMTSTNIIGVRGMIRHDDGGQYYPISSGNESGASVGDANIVKVTSTDIIISRKASGTFDSVNFDSTSYNRGWVVVDYLT